jgi:hypothetical protein
MISPFGSVMEQVESARVAIGAYGRKACSVRGRARSPCT